MNDSTVSDVSVIIPVRRLNNSKSRLANILSGELRRKLNKQMLQNVINACLKTDKLKRIIVISPDDEILELARENDIEIANEEFERGVNGAITYILEKFREDISSILILPSDLPLVTSRDLSKIISVSKKEPSIVISPSSRMDGTNALLLKPVSAIPLFFDQDSFSNHLRSALINRVKTTIYISRNIILDIDTPYDLREFCSYREAKFYNYIRDHVNLYCS